MPTTALWGEIAGVLSLAALPIYLRAILRGTTRPNRVTWWILALVSGMIATSSYASGTRDAIWLPIEYAASFIAIGLLSIRYGDGAARLDTLDSVCLTGALASVAVWWAFDSPQTALYMNIAVDFIAIVPTIKKAYVKPWTEDKAAWAIASLASFINVFAIEQWTFTISAYPLYLFVTNLLITGFVLRPRRPPIANPVSQPR
jgi:hypothetical protein